MLVPREVTALRVPVAALSSGEHTLDDEPSRYVARVHRSAEGDRLVLFDGAARLEADARIVAIEEGRVRVSVDAPRAASRVARREVTLVQAIGKGDKLDAIVRDATELGVTRIVPVETARTIVRLGAKGPERAERWRRIAREAARQCLRGDVPAVDDPCPLGRALAIDATLKLALAPGGSAAATHLRAISETASIALLVGPEGGLTDDELAEAEQAGWARASLGAFVLRTETVAAAMLGAIAILDGGRA